jgi:hypothetical protein
MTDWVADGIAGSALLVSGVAAWRADQAARYRAPWVLTNDGRRYLLVNAGRESALDVELEPAASPGVRISGSRSHVEMGPGEAMGFSANLGLGVEDDRVVVRWRRPRRSKRLTWVHPLPRGGGAVS